MQGCPEHSASHPQLRRAGGKGPEGHWAESQESRVGMMAVSHAMLQKGPEQLVAARAQLRDIEISLEI